MGAERTSIYSATGILASERNSFYAKQGLGTGTGGDGASTRSGPSWATDARIALRAALEG